MPYAYAYVSLVAALGIVWLALFLLRRDLRREQLTMSLIIAPASLTQYIFYQDYWRPEYFLPSFKFLGVPIGLEEPLFVFFVAGIMAVIYEVVFKKKIETGKRRPLALWILPIALVFFVALSMLGIQSIWASIIAAIVIAAPILYYDRCIRVDAVMTAALMFLLSLGIYIVWFAVFPNVGSQLWLPSAFSGIRLLGLPIEELVWYASWALLGGVFYEFWTGVGKYRRL